MGNEQVYNPMSGINRMITDIENFMEPILFELHPILHIFGKINVWVVLAVFVGLMSYLLFIRKHSLTRRFYYRETYFIMIGGLVLFDLLNRFPLRIGPSISLNFGIIIIPIIAKFLGPVMAAIFGICQYFLQFLNINGQEFSLSAMFIGSISGMIYSLFIYDKRTKYVRCFIAKLLVNIFCNVLLVPIVTTDSMTVELSRFIADRIIENIFLVPIQALFIYWGLKLAKKLRGYLKW